jgi:hypothetical protein
VHRVFNEETAVCEQVVLPSRSSSWRTEREALRGLALGRWPGALWGSVRRGLCQGAVHVLDSEQQSIDRVFDLEHGQPTNRCVVEFSRPTRTERSRNNPQDAEDAVLRLAGGFRIASQVGANACRGAVGAWIHRVRHLGLPCRLRERRASDFPSPPHGNCICPQPFSERALSQRERGREGVRRRGFASPVRPRRRTNSTPLPPWESGGR